MIMASQEAALAFIYTLQRNFPNYKAFSEALIDFVAGNTDRPTLVSRVSALLDGHRDFMVCFNNFLPEEYKVAIPSAEEQPTENFSAEIPTRPQLSLKRSNPGEDAVEFEKKVRRGAVEFVNKVRKFSTDDDVYSSFLRVVTDFRIHKDIVRVDKEISALFKANPELYVEFTWFAADSWPGENPVNGQKQDLGESFPETAAKKIAESEEILEKCEDKLFESDMLFHSLESTKKAAERLLKKTEEKGNGDQRIDIEDYYSAMNLRCIEQMYRSSEEDIIELLRRNPTGASSILLHRLNEKLEEARKWGKELRKSCVNTIRNCHGETERRKEANQAAAQCRLHIPSRVVLYGPKLYSLYCDYT